MTSFEPPSGADDLAAEAEAIEAEKQRMEEQHAAVIQARQERRVAQGRADLEQQRAELEQRRAELAAEMAALDAAEAGDRPVIVDVDPVPTVNPAPAVQPAEPAEPAPDYRDAAVWDIDPATGEAFRDWEGRPIPAWPYTLTEYKGRTFQVRPLGPAAMQSLGLISSKYTPAQVKGDLVTKFLTQYMSGRSYAEMLAAMLDPDTDLQDSDLSGLVEHIATQGTGRPTLPSQG